jgi:hypothetical protein
VKLTMWRDSAYELLKELAAKSADGKSFGNVTFQIHLDFIEDDQSHDADIVDCQITGVDDANQEGADPLKTDLTIMPMYIRRDGLTLFENDGTR